MGRYRTIGAPLQPAMISALDDIADEYDTDRSAVIRALLDASLRAYKQDEDWIDPLSWEAQNAAQQTQDGYHPRWDE